MAFDTDLIGAYALCVDMPRTWLCGAGRPSGAQLDLMVRAGVSLHEVTEKLRCPLVEELNGYTVLAHGTGL